MFTEDSVNTHTFVTSPEHYDRMIDWSARLGRELPFFRALFGPPGPNGLLDAGCGTGRHAVALAREGYRVTGLDASEHMLAFARRLASAQGADVQFIPARFEQVTARAAGPFDGVYCVGNSLAAAGSADAVRAAIAHFARVLVPGGRLVVQVLNFSKLLREVARGGALTGPQSATIDGREYVTIKLFAADPPRLVLTAVTLWREEDRWQKHVTRGRLWPVRNSELSSAMREAGLRIVARYGNYRREPYRAATSQDLIVVAARRR